MHSNMRNIFTTALLLGSIAVATPAFADPSQPPADPNANAGATSNTNATDPNSTATDATANGNVATPGATTSGSMSSSTAAGAAMDQTNPAADTSAETKTKAGKHHKKNSTESQPDPNAPQQQ
jgi:hypothetical protein